MTARLTRAALTCAALSLASVRAEPYQIVAATSNAPTEVSAQLMSTKGLENVIEAKGMKSQEPVKTKCEAGTIMIECRSQQKPCK